MRGHVPVEALRHGPARHTARDLRPELIAVVPGGVAAGKHAVAGRALAGLPEHLRRQWQGDWEACGLNRVARQAMEC